MKKILTLLLALCLLFTVPALSEEVVLESAVDEVTLDLEGDPSAEEEEKAQQEPEVQDEAGSAPDDDWDEGDYIIPYPDVTSREIQKLLRPSKRVYPGKLVWPLPGTPILQHITSHVGWRNAARIYSHQGGTWPSWLHHGIDVGGVTTRQLVVAAAGGKAYVGQKGGEGRYVVIDHGNGWYTEYQHLSGYAGSLHKGSHKVKVEAGDPIGYVGNSGGDYPVHFHFEIAYSPKGPGSSDKKYFRQTKNRTIRAYSFAQEAVVELHWAKTWEICTAERQHFVASAKELEED